MADGDQRAYGFPSAGTVTTTSAAQTGTLCQVRVPDNCTVFLIGRYVVQNKEGSTYLQSGWVFGLANSVSSTATIRGTVKHPASLKIDGQLMDLGATFDASGADVRMRVTGDATYDCVWTGSIEMARVECTIP
jgi:hypothetical protein